MNTTKWEADTHLPSSVATIVKHPAYQKIISIGIVVVPLILQRIKLEQGHWSLALRDMTGVY